MFAVHSSSLSIMAWFGLATSKSPSLSGERLKISQEASISCLDTDRCLLVPLSAPPRVLVQSVLERREPRRRRRRPGNVEDSALIVSSAQTCICMEYDLPVDLPEGFAPSEFREDTLAVLFETNDGEGSGNSFSTVEAPGLAVISRIGCDQIGHCTDFTPSPVETASEKRRTKTLIGTADLVEWHIIETSPGTLHYSNASLEHDLLVSG
jgi:hypothetical protein